MKKRLLLTSMLLSVIVGFATCDKNDSVNPTPHSNRKPKATVYAAGYDIFLEREEDSDYQYIAKQWINGIETVLSEYNSRANDIFVYEDDVYTVGVIDTSSKSYEEKGILWKNGQIAFVSNSAELLSVYVSEQGVFFVGTSRDAEGEYKGKLWKDRSVIYTTPNTRNHFLTVVGSGDELYIGGYSGIDADRATIWRYKYGAVSTIFTSDSDDSVISSLFLKGNLLYATGHKDDDSGTDYPILWVGDLNTEPVVFHSTKEANMSTDGAGYASSVSATDNYVYLAINTSNPSIWNTSTLYNIENATFLKTNLIKDGSFGEVESVFAHNNDIYVSGVKMSIILKTLLKARFGRTAPFFIQFQRKLSTGNL